MVSNYYGKGEPRPEPPKPFDFLEEQGMAKDCLNGEKLFKQYDALCKLHEKQMIPAYQYEELKDLIFGQLEKLKKIKKSIV